jgi:hypothetical protein
MEKYFRWPWTVALLFHEEGWDCETPGFRVNRPVHCCFSLSDSQDEGAAGSTACTAKITRISARSIDRHTGCPRTGDQGGRDRDLQLLATHDRSA